MLSRIGQPTEEELASIDEQIREVKDDLRRLYTVRRIMMMAVNHDVTNASILVEIAKEKRAVASFKRSEAPKQSNGKLLAAERRLTLARCIAEKGPASMPELSVRTGITRYGLFSVVKLIDHPWFELIDRVVHLSTIGHQAVTGKDGTEQ